MGFRDCLSTPSVFVHHLGVSHDLQQTGDKPPHPDLPNIFCIPSELQSAITKRPRKHTEVSHSSCIFFVHLKRNQLCWLVVGGVVTGGGVCLAS